MPTFSISEHDAIGQWLHDGLRSAAHRGALSAAMRTVQHITTVLIPGEKMPPIDTRAYTAAWRAEPTAKGADVFNDIPYAIIIEDGARAENIKIGNAMIEALTEWVIRKGLAGRASASATKQRERQVNARNIAWAIAVSMKSKGIFNRDGRKGLQIKKRAEVFARNILSEEIQREVAREFKG